MQQRYLVNCLCLGNVFFVITEPVSPLLPQRSYLVKQQVVQNIPVCTFLFRKRTYGVYAPISCTLGDETACPAVSSGLRGSGERGVFLFRCCGRIPIGSGAGYLVHQRADFNRALSCPTDSVKRFGYYPVCLQRKDILLRLRLSLVHPCFPQ
jgi:hypothetical protein